MAKKLTATQKANANTRYSSFWFDDDDYSVSRYTGGYFTDYGVDDKDDKDDKSYTAKAEKTLELIKLGAFMRSCGNFVRILTGRQDIVVKYSEGDESYTDGKTVTLSSNVEGNFDSTVGLALHEASHICKTDFELLISLFESVSERRKVITHQMINRVVALNPKIAKWDWKEIFGKTLYSVDNSLSPAQVCADMFLLVQFKDISNWIEDRRIDNWVYSTAPGYRGYYESLYNRYFYSDDVTKALEANKTFNTETLDSYMYHIINSLNPKQHADALKGLKEIKQLIDVVHIDRLNNSAMVNEVASKVLGVVMDNITELDFKTQQMRKFGKDGDCHDGKGNDDGMSIDIDSLTDKECKDMFGIGKPALKRLLKKMQEQRDFVGGEVKKKSISKTDAMGLASLQSNGVSVELAGGEEFNGQQVQVMVIKRLDEAVMDNETFRNVFVSSDRMGRYGCEQMEQTIGEGFVLGKQLGARLQIRNEEKTLKFTRQDAGKMDRRLVASLGYDMENVFSKVETNKFQKAHIHISVDASGSMGGSKFRNVIKMCVAIAVASKMTQNIECVITFRTTTYTNPLVYVAYDSRINSTAHIRKFFPRFTANGSTPESLCFEALMHDVFPTNTGVDEQFYFVNLSDGEPGYSNSANDNSFHYGGENAYRHCKRMVDKMVRNGATILSYFVSDDDSESGIRSLRKMYGMNNAFNINTSSVEQIARTMNRKFLEGGGKKNNDGGSI